MLRVDLHTEVDKMLDALGYGDDVLPMVDGSFGGIVFQLNFEEGREVFRIKERETEKVFSKRK